MLTTQKDIRAQYADLDMTNYKTSEIYHIIDNDPVVEHIAYSHGVYGVNGVYVRLTSGRTAKSVGHTNATIILA